MRKSNEFLGLDGFVWWTGVVEDRDDPLQLGRCKVRCMGWHDENIDKLPTNDLPWAQPLQPITSAALAGVGTSATGLLEGSWVVGFFMDGKEAQFPVIMGSLAGISGDGEVMGTGFRDPEGLYPTADFKGKPDTPTLARGEEISSNESPAYQNKISGRLEGVKTAKGADVGTILSRSIPESGEWSEPEPRGSKDSEYPLNHVRKTEAGHIFEVDDSVGAERIHTYHSSGTFEEIQPDGTKVTKVVGENYEIIAKGQNVSIKGGCNITVEGDTRILTKGDYIHEVTGNYHLSTKGNFVQQVGSYSQKVEVDKVTEVAGLYDIKSASLGVVTKGNIDIDSGGDVGITASDDLFFLAADDTVMQSGGTFNLASNEVSVLAMDGALNLASKKRLNIEADDSIFIVSSKEEDSIIMGRSPALFADAEKDNLRDAEVEITGNVSAGNSADRDAEKDKIPLDGHVHEYVGPLGTLDTDKAKA